MKPNLPRGLTFDKKRNQYRIRFRSLHSDTGRDYRERLPAGTTRRQAEAHLSRLREDDRSLRLSWRDERESEQRRRSAGLFESFVGDVYQPYIKDRVKPTTYKNKQMSLLSCLPWLEGLHLDDIDAAALERVTQSLRSEGLRASSVNSKMMDLRACLNVAHKLGYRAEKAPSLAPLKKTDSKPSKWLTLEEAQALLDKVAHKPRWYALALFLLHTGARITETLSLTWDDIDTERELVTFRAEETKSGKSRSVPLLPEVVEALSRLDQDTERIWSYNRSAVRYALCSPHILRHTFAAWRLSAGVSIAKVQAWLGHASIQMTVDLYGHIQPEDFASDIGRCHRPKGRALKIVKLSQG